MVEWQYPRLPPSVADEEIEKQGGLRTAMVDCRQCDLGGMIVEAASHSAEAFDGCVVHNGLSSG